MPTKTSFVCRNCSFQSTKWQGKCPECLMWNTFEETAVLISNKNKSSPQFSNRSKKGENNKPETLSALWNSPGHDQAIHPFLFSAEPLNRFWGGGLNPGSVTLLAGEPGLGKSTLGLQLLRALMSNKMLTKQKLPLCWYITAEESTFDMSKRAKRLDIPGEVVLLQSNHWDEISILLDQQKPDIIILDSIQTVFDSNVTSNPGSVTQVTSVASQLLEICKSSNIAAIIIGHVTKEGQIAGPKTLEHLVDSVLLLEPTEQPNFRTLSFSKHRFGSTQQLLLLKMEENGLQIVTNPSLALLENMESGVGICYGVALDKNLPLVVEVQSLVTTGGDNQSSWFGRREGLGLKTAKLNTILAILEKHCNTQLKSRDVYVQITGLPPNTQDDSIDLAVALSILSSLHNKPIQDVKIGNKLSKVAFAGRLTLSGGLRIATQNQDREKMTNSLGFGYNINIDHGKPLSHILKIFNK